MPATVIADWISWPCTMNPLRVRLREIRPEYVGVDPVDRVHYEPGEVTQCDLWFPAVQIPVDRGQSRVLPMLGFFRFQRRQLLAKESRAADD